MAKFITGQYLEKVICDISWDTEGILLIVLRLSNSMINLRNYLINTSIIPSCLF